MAAKVWYTTPDTATGDTNFAALTETDPGTEATTATGWTVGTTAPTVYDEMDRGTEVSGGFGAGALPDTTLVTGATSDSFRTEGKLNGTFANASWSLKWRVIAVGNGGSQDGNLRCRVFKSVNADGTSATELTAAVLSGGAVTNLTTSAAQSSDMTWSPGELTLTNEYLFFSLAWVITGAGGMAAADVLLRRGGANCTITSADFVPVITQAGASMKQVALDAVQSYGAGQMVAFQSVRPDAPQ